jgi:hypothetical protein
MKVRSLMIYALSAILTATFTYITPVWANDNTDNSSSMVDQNQNNSSANSNTSDTDNADNNQNNDQNSDHNATPDTATGGDDDY